MICRNLWRDETLHIGDALAGEYASRLERLGLTGIARQRDHHGEAGGEDAEATDRHFALQFVNSAGRAVYICIDALASLGDLTALINRFFSGGRIVLVEVPCGAGAGSLGLLSAIIEQRMAGLVPTLPLYVDIVGGDVSSRGLEHFELLLSHLTNASADSEIQLTSRMQLWDASDIRSSSRFIDHAVEVGRQADQVFLLVSNFSDALVNDELKAGFEHFLSQFLGRFGDTPHAICWIEPVSNKGEKAQSSFRKFFERIARWLASTVPSDEGVRYSLFDPIRQKSVPSGVRVLRSEQTGMP